MRRGILISFVSAFLQGLVAIAVVGIAYVVLRGTAISMTDATRTLEIASYAMIAKTQKWIPSDCRLSKREVECLRFAAIGKTDREISMILELSHATVRYHVQRAGEKLNAVNRSQAVFKAGQLGYLGAAA